MRVSGSARVQTRATVERAFAVLTDFPAYPDWYPGVSTAETLSDEGSARPRVRLVFDAGVPAVPQIEAVLRFEIDTPTRLVPRLDGGNLRRLDGPGWRLDPLADGGCTITHELTVEMDLPGGRLVERALSGRAKRLLIEAPVQELGRRAERVG